MRNILLAAILTATTIEGSAAIRGTVLTPEGNPVPTATVQLFALEDRDAVLERLGSDSPTPEPLAEVKTDARGNFSIDAPRGTSAVRVQISKDGYAPAGAWAAPDLDLAGILLRAAPMERGVVRDGAEPLAGAVVRYVSAEGAEWIARTDEEGRYTVPAPGVWARHVTVFSPDGYVWEESAGRNALAIDRRLRRGTDLTGRLLAADGRTPVAGAEIRLDGAIVGATDGNGGFRIAAPPAGWSLVEFITDEAWASRPSSAGTDLSSLRLGAPSRMTGTLISGRDAVAGARITVLPDLGGVFFSARAQIDAISDARGRFSIAHLPPGRYRVLAHHPLYSVESAAVELQPGEVIDKEISAAALPLVTGFVVDAEGRAVAGAEVRPLVDAPTRIAMMRSVGSDGTWSAGDGRFAVRTLPPDVPVELEARKRGLPPASTEPLKLSAGQIRTGLRIVIEPGYEVSGRVVDPEGNPIEGATVAAEESRSEGGRSILILGSESTEQDGVRTDADGNFVLQIGEGRWDVSASGSEWARAVRRGIEVDRPLDGIELTLQPAVSVRGRVVRTESGGIAGANVTFMAREGGPRSTITAPDGSFEITGLTPGSSMLMIDKPDEMLREMRMVTAPAEDLLIEIPEGATLSGRVIDGETKAPVTSFTISVSADRSGGGMMIRTIPTPRNFQSDQGEFSLSNVTTDPAELIVQAPGYVEKRVRGVEAPAGETREGIEIAMSRGTAVTGRVTDPSGQPLSGVTVARDDGNRVMGPPRLSGNATDAEGKFEIGPFDDEVVTLRFERDGYRHELREVKLSGRTASVDVRMTRGAALTGQVVTEAGAPVEGARVSVRSGADFITQTSATTDSSGAFRVEGLPEGRVRVSASRSGFSTATRDDVDPSTSGPIRLVLSEGGTVAGRILGLSVSELADAAVEVRSGSGVSRGQVDHSGAFRVDGVAPGTARVRATVGRFGPGRTSPEASVEVSLGAEAYVELDMSQGYEITGVVSVNGSPASEVMLSFSPADPVIQTRSSATTDSMGRYRAAGLAPGNYRVSAVRFGTGDVSWQGEYRVEGDDRFDIDIEGVDLRGRVIDASTGRGVEGAALELRREGGVTFIMPGTGPVSGPDGSFTFRNITPGRWTVRASAKGLGAAAETIDVGSSGAAIELRLSPSEGVVMRVVDASSGTPVSSFVSVRDGLGQTVLSQLMRPGADGTVRLTISPGAYRVRVQAPGYAPRWITVTSPSAGVTVPLSRGGTLEINVGSSEPVRARIVDTTSGEAIDSTPGGLTALRPGSNILHNVPAGQVRVDVLDESGIVTRSELIVVAEGGTATLHL